MLYLEDQKVAATKDMHDAVDKKISGLKKLINANKAENKQNISRLDDKFGVTDFKIAESAKLMRKECEMLELKMF